MVADNEILHYAELMAELMRAYREKHTGSMFFLTPDNRMAQINFDRGDIVFIYYRGKRGEDALRLLPEIQRARVIFEDESEAAIRIPLPSTKNIIGYLTESEAATRVLPMTARKSPAELRSPREIIEAALIRNVGPMGGMLCDEAFDRRMSLENTIQHLSTFIPKPRNAQHFRISLHKLFASRISKKRAARKTVKS